MEKRIRNQLFILILLSSFFFAGTPNSFSATNKLDLESVSGDLLVFNRILLERVCATNSDYEEELTKANQFINSNPSEKEV